MIIVHLYQGTEKGSEESNVRWSASGLLVFQKTILSGVLWTVCQDNLGTIFYGFILKMDTIHSDSSSVL